MTKILGGGIVLLPATLVLWPNCFETLPGKLLYGHFLVVVPFHFNTNELRQLTPPFVRGQSQDDRHDDNCWGRSSAPTGVQAPLLSKRQGNREAPVLRAIFSWSFYHAWTMKQSRPWNKTRWCVGVSVLSHHSPWHLEALCTNTRLFSMVYFLWYVYFELYLLKKVEISYHSLLMNIFWSGTLFKIALLQIDPSR